MPALKYKVELNESERTHLKEIASRGETSARKVKRALVLLKADEGLIDRDIASGLLISASTVGRVRTQYVQEGPTVRSLNARDQDRGASWTVGRKHT